ncbi:MAG TPA: glycoside hydrolase [Ignavibacteriales bacterium]|nr:glycoside hydrolase [Ignavibacteriales bacterium]
MRLVFLVINYMPHQLVSIKSLINFYDAEVHSFNYKDDDTIPTDISGLITYRLKDFNDSELFKKIADINPAMIVVAGWFVQEYVRVSKKISKELNIPTIASSDTQWRGSLRQRINCIASPFHLKKAFTNIWVAGIYQYEYARKLGFKKNEIIFNALSCDFELFNKVDIESKKKKYPKTFLFIGRFIKIKGIEYLIEAWNKIVEKKGWTLKLIGDGKLTQNYCDRDDIVIMDFMNQTDLVLEMQNAGCLILPSLFEQWALVLHEAAAAGLPIIASDVCGATNHFLINGFNGYRINAGDVKQLGNAIENVINLESNELINFSLNSRKLAQSITPEIGAANLMSVLYNKINIT